MSIRVLVADDQEMVRTGFRLILDAQPDMDVVAEAADGLSAEQAARTLHPDVCLLDIRMPGLNGLDLTRRLAGPGVSNPLRVVVITTFDLDEYLYGALRAGACGFLLKDAGPALLVEAVRAAATGNALISPSMTVRLLQRLDLPRRDRVAPPHESLTGRELDVVRLVGRGRTNAEIAGELFLSLSTVKTHLSSVQAKLPARNRVEIAAWAWTAGIMEAT